MNERNFTAHVELNDGRYHSFTVTARNLRVAYHVATARVAPEHTLRGVTEDEES